MERRQNALRSLGLWVGLPLCVCGCPFSLVICLYLYPPAIREDDERAYFLLATPAQGPESGRTLYGFRATDALEGRTQPHLSVPARKPEADPLDLARLRLARPKEVAALLGRRFKARPEQVEDRGMGASSIQIAVDGDTISVVRDDDRDKVVFSDRCAYRVERGRARFLYHRRYDSSWPDFR